MINYVEYQRNKNKKDPIIGFFKENYWLSNFYQCDITSNDFVKPLTFGSSEALFQALKCPLRADEFEGLTPDEAKHLGRKVQLRSNWEEIKLDCMRYCLRSKFNQHEALKEKLMLTGKGHLEEANTWGDKFWGTVDGVGENWLGQLLMELRDEYQNEYERKMNLLNQ